MKNGGFLKRYVGLRRSGNRYGAKPVHNLMTGQTFDSKGEYGRWGELRLLERAGHLSSLTQHPKIILVPGVSGLPEIAWHPDYSYVEDGRVVYEDYKPRKVTDRENLLFKLWRHFGPGPLRITSHGGKLLKQIAGKP